MRQILLDIINSTMCCKSFHLVGMNLYGVFGLASDFEHYFIQNVKYLWRKKQRDSSFFSFTLIFSSLQDHLILLHSHFGINFTSASRILILKITLDNVASVRVSIQKWIPHPLWPFNFFSSGHAFSSLTSADVLMLHKLVYFRVYER